VFVKDFAKLLSSEYRVFVIAPGKKNQERENFGFEVIYFPWFYSEFGLSSLNPKNFKDLFRLLTALVSGTISVVKIIKKTKPDLCIAMWAIPSGIFCYVAKIFFNRPYIVWALGSDIWKVRDYPLGKIILKKVLCGAKKLFADGIVLAKDVTEISGQTCDFLASNRILKKIDENITFDNSKTNFIFLGRYHENKGTDLLIDAVSKLSDDEKKRVFFHIYGMGPLKEKIKRKTMDQNLEHCIKINDVLESDKVYSYIQNSDFVIIPSRIESIPLILSDAMQGKKPVVATNVGDMGKLISEFKVGIITEPSANSIATGIREALKLTSEEKKKFESGIEKLADYLDIRNSTKIVKQLID